MTIKLAGYDFENDCSASVCNHVRDGRPVLVFSHDFDGLQFLCGEVHESLDDWAIYHLNCAPVELAQLSDLPKVDQGFVADRDGLGLPWIVSVNELEAE